MSNQFFLYQHLPENDERLECSMQQSEFRSSLQPQSQFDRPSFAPSDRPSLAPSAQNQPQLFASIVGHSAQVSDIPHTPSIQMSQQPMLMSQQPMDQTLQSVVIGRDPSVDSIRQSVLVSKGEIKDSQPSTQSRQDKYTPLLDQIKNESKNEPSLGKFYNNSSQSSVPLNNQSFSPNQQIQMNHPQQQQFQMNQQINSFPQNMSPNSYSQNMSPNNYSQNISPNNYSQNMSPNNYPQNMQPNNYPQNFQQNSQIPQQSYYQPMQQSMPPQQKKYIAQCPLCTTIQQIQNFAPYKCYHCQRIVENMSYQSIFTCSRCPAIVVYQQGISSLIQCSLCGTVNLIPQKSQSVPFQNSVK